MNGKGIKSPARRRRSQRRRIKM